MKLLFTIFLCGILIPILPLCAAFALANYDRSTTLYMWLAGIGVGVLEVGLLLWVIQGSAWHWAARLVLYAGSGAVGAPIVAYVLWKVILGGYIPGR